MTDYERIINAHVVATTTATIGRAVDDIAESIATDMLRDPAIRAELRAIIVRAFRSTITAMRTPNGRPRRKKRGRR